MRELQATKERSQSDLPDKLGVSRQTVNTIEMEKYDLSLPLAFKGRAYSNSRSRTSSKWMRPKWNETEEA